MPFTPDQPLRMAPPASVSVQGMGLRLGSCDDLFEQSALLPPESPPPVHSSPNSRSLSSPSFCHAYRA
ncbi:unnamed protein product [Protopolystoma xenopodis]|uniref:Uncharacterized protein n=1 Tax=Protopolystoma xenopodis TaxID=117903 RepID=A0A448WSQ1_9PLAT|nr:unnamed protein product [Protopolystoma xenopodis]